jgi:hypothetical protein
VSRSILSLSSLRPLCNTWTIALHVSVQAHHTTLLGLRKAHLYHFVYDFHCYRQQNVGLIDPRVGQMKSMTNGMFLATLPFPF